MRTSPSGRWQDRDGGSRSHGDAAQHRRHLDSSFGSAAWPTSTWATGQISAVALQPDGKILGGRARMGERRHQVRLLVVRYNADGHHGHVLGTGGYVTTSFSSIYTYERVNSIVVQLDGKIVLGATPRTIATAMTSALVRYNANGTLDTTFGSGGKVLTTARSGGKGPVTPPSDDSIAALALQPDGKIVAGGPRSAPRWLTSRWPGTTPTAPTPVSTATAR
ncbi:MAG: hypothetical protein U0797_30540 [Gemmataceae bacterium]